MFFILLSLKTTHHTYEDVYNSLIFKFFPWRKLLDAEPKEVEGVIREGGLGTIKSRAFVDIAKRLKEDFGVVSLTSLKAMQTAKAEMYLRSLPGVGIKTARCVLMYSLGRNVLPVDTHTYRVGVRLELIPSSRSSEDSHRLFEEMVPEELRYCLHTNFVALGREFCLDPIPKCNQCPLTARCPFSSHEQNGKAKRHGTLCQSTHAGEGRVAKDLRPQDLTAKDLFAGCGGLSADLRKRVFALLTQWTGIRTVAAQRTVPISPAP